MNVSICLLGLLDILYSLRVKSGKRACVYGSLSLAKTENAVETKNM